MGISLPWVSGEITSAEYNRDGCIVANGTTISPELSERTKQALDEAGIAIANYVAPVASNLEKRTAEFAKLDGMVAQIIAYEMEGKDASQKKAEYLALRAAIYDKYPD